MNEVGRQTHCANCGALLTDRYCGRCGQDSHVSLSFGHFMHELAEGLFHVGSKFWRTLRALVVRPGLLTEQYLGGKRHSYSPPFRSYLVISIVYFVLASLFAAPVTRVVSPGSREMQASDCAQIAANPGWLLRLVPDLEGSCVRALSDDRQAPTAVMENLLPKVMFVVLPLVALVQFWIYRRQRPLYLENLVFILHFQSFYYLASAAAVLLAAAIAAVAGAEAKPGELFEFAIYVWSVVYLFIAMRRVYGAGTFKTVLALAALAVSYIVFYALGVSAAGTGAWTALDVFRRVRAHVGTLRLAWLAATAVAMGLSIWSMHFIAMLGFKPGAEVRYDVGRTILSLLLAIATTAFAFFFRAGGGSQAGCRSRSDEAAGDWRELRRVDRMNRINRMFGGTDRTPGRLFLCVSHPVHPVHPVKDLSLPGISMPANVSTNSRSSARQSH